MSHANLPPCQRCRGTLELAAFEYAPAAQCRACGAAHTQGPDGAGIAAAGVGLPAVGVGRARVGSYAASPSALRRRTTLFQ
jgi:hypothetical protein